MDPATYKAAVELFERCLPLDRAGRVSVLTEACGSNLDLRRRVEQMLEADEHEDTPIVHTLLDRVLEQVGEGDEPPDSLGPYRIIRELGRGGMGIVYEAEQDEPRRRVALKALSMFGSKAMARRLRQEAHVLGQLEHPGIARVYDAGAARFRGHHTPYIVMELVRGEPIDRFVRDNDLTLEQRLELVARVADAVHAAHERGVVHRDLKPGNILVAPSDDGIGSPKVLDFGVARVRGDGLQVTSVHTETGQLIGTLNYMSPEQLEGRSEQIDARCDVYALGVVLHELLSGNRPAELDGVPIVQAVDRLRRWRPGDLSIGGQTAPPRLALIVSTAAATEPERRYESASALAADLRAFVLGTALHARAPSASYQLREYARRNRLVVAVTLATLTALSVGLAGTTWFGVSAAMSERHGRWMTHRAFVAAASGASDRGDFLAARRYLDDCPEEHRGWEWDFLNGMLTPSGVAFGGVPVRSISGDEAGGFALALSSGEVVRWDLDSEEVRTLPVAVPLVTLAEESSSGVAAGLSARGAIVVFSSETGAVLAEIDPLSDERWGRPALSRDGSRLIANGPGMLRVWEIPSGAIALELDVRGGRGLALSPDGRWAGAVERNGRAAWYDVETGERKLARARNPSQRIAFSPDGETVAIGSALRDVYLFDVENPAIGTVLSGHAGRAIGLQFTDDGRLITAFSDNTWRIWDPLSGRMLSTHPMSEEGRVSVVGSVFVTSGTGDSVLSLWTLDRMLVAEHPQFVYAVGWSPDGSMLASMAYEGGGSIVWDAGTLSPIKRLDTAGRGRPIIRFTPDGNHLIQAHRRSGRPSVSAWNTATWESAGTGLSPDSTRQLWGGTANLQLPSARHSPDGRLVIDAVSPDTWAIRDAEREIARTRQESNHSAIAWSPDSRTVVTGSMPGAANVWTAPSFELEVSLEHVPGLWSAAFTPDGTRLATGGDDGIIRIFDTKRWEPLLEIRGHDSYVHALAFSPDGTRLASGSGDGTVRIWESVPPAARADLANRD